MQISTLSALLAITATSFLGISSVNAQEEEEEDPETAGPSSWFPGTPPPVNVTAERLAHALAPTNPADGAVATVGSPLNITWVVSDREGERWAPAAVNITLWGVWALEGPEFERCGLIADHIENTGWTEWDVLHAVLPGSDGNNTTSFDCEGWRRVFDKSDTEGTAFLLFIGDALDFDYGRYSKPFFIHPRAAVDDNNTDANGRANAATPTWPV